MVSSSSSSSSRTGSSSSRTGSSSSTRTDELPDPWYEFKDEKSGEPYYYNAETKETTWHRPTLEAQPTRPQPTRRSTSQDEEIAELKRQLQLEKDKVLKVIQESEKVVVQSLSEQSRQLHEIERLSAKLEEVNAERTVYARRVIAAEQRATQLQTQLGYLREELETERSNAKDAMTCLSRLQKRQKILLRERNMNSCTS